MKVTVRIIGLLIAASLAITLLASCEPPQEGDDGTWVYDFMTDGDAIEGSDWYIDAGWTGETAHGYWLNQASIAAPYLFTGDFTAEFEFYLKYVSADDYIFRYAFRLVDPQWESSTNRKYCSLAAEYTAFPQHTDANYQVSQGNGTFLAEDYFTNVPGVTGGLNTCKMVKVGSTVTMYMNGALVDTVTVDTLNQPLIGYAPLIHGHNSWDEADTNFYIRKLTVTYVPGERVAYNWNE